MLERKVWQVERFVPRRCPNPQCGIPFYENNSGNFLLYEFWKGITAARVSEISSGIHIPGVQTDLVMCVNCQNVTLRAVLERRRFANQADALAALAQGFANLQECLVTGDVPIIEG